MVDEHYGGGCSPWRRMCTMAGGCALWREDCTIEGECTPELVFESIAISLLLLFWGWFFLGTELGLPGLCIKFLYPLGHITDSFKKLFVLNILGSCVSAYNTRIIHMPGFLCGCGGFKLMFSCLHNTLLSHLLPRSLELWVHLLVHLCVCPRHLVLCTQLSWTNCCHLSNPCEAYNLSLLLCLPHFWLNDFFHIL